MMRHHHGASSLRIVCMCPVLQLSLRAAAARGLSIAEQRRRPRRALKSLSRGRASYCSAALAYEAVVVL